MKNTIDTLEPRAGGGQKWWRVAGYLALALAVLGGASLVTASHLGGPMGFRHGPFDAETAKERIEFASGFVLEKIDADEAQEATIQALLDDTVDDLAVLAVEHRAGREAMRELLLQETIDRVALEQIRADQMRLAEQASQRLVTTLADVAEALTLEQRQQLAEMARRHHDH